MKRVFVEGLGEWTRGVRRLGRIPDRCSTGGPWFTGQNWKKNHSSVRAECRKHPKSLSLENSPSKTFCYFGVAGVIVIGLVRRSVQPAIELTNIERHFQWV